MSADSELMLGSRHHEFSQLRRRRSGGLVEVGLFERNSRPPWGLTFIGSELTIPGLRIIAGEGTHEGIIFWVYGVLGEAQLSR